MQMHKYVHFLPCGTLFLTLQMLSTVCFITGLVNSISAQGTSAFSWALEEPKTYTYNHLLLYVHLSSNLIMVSSQFIIFVFYNDDKNYSYRIIFFFTAAEIIGFFFTCSPSTLRRLLHCDALNQRPINTGHISEVGHMLQIHYPF